MDPADRKSGGEPDPLSATGMFLNAFDRQLDASDAERPANETKPAGPSEFTQLFGSPKQGAPPAAPAPQQTPKQSSEEATRIFPSQAAPPAAPPVVRPAPIPTPSPNPPRMKGFSAPGASDSASDDGSFTQLFRAVPPGPLSSPEIPQPLTQASPASTPKSLGSTDLFRALSENEPAIRPTRRSDLFSEPAPAPGEPGSVTMWIRKLSEKVEPSQPVEPQAMVPPPEPVSISGQGEYTRIISGDAMKAASGVPVSPAPPVPKFQAPAVEPPKVAVPKISPQEVPPPQSKLQQMVPILLVLNTFLLVILILVGIFALMRK